MNTLRLFALGCCLTIAGCKDEGEEPTSVSGHIIALDGFDYPLADNSGFLVRAEGTFLTTTTNAHGEWTLYGLTPGTYIFESGKSEFCTERVQVTFDGGHETVDPFFVSQPPPWYVSSLTLAFDSVGLNVEGTIFPRKGVQGKILVFVGLTNAVSSDPTTYLWDDDGRYYRIRGSLEESLFTICIVQECHLGQ